MCSFYSFLLVFDPRQRFHRIQASSFPFSIHKPPSSHRQLLPSQEDEGELCSAALEDTYVLEPPPPALPPASSGPYRLFEAQVAGEFFIVSYLISGVCAMLSVLCYSQFAVELSVTGGSYAYLRDELGDFVAYIVSGNILFEYIVAGASVTRLWTSYFATLYNGEPNGFRIYVGFLAMDYNYLDPIAVAVSFVVCVAASWSTKGSSRFNFVTTIIHLVLIFILAHSLFNSFLKPF